MRVLLGVRLGRAREGDFDFLRNRLFEFVVTWR